MTRPRTLAVALCLAAPLLAPAPAAADTALGDWGHFLSYAPKILLHNPEGKAFTVTVHVMCWAVRRWNRPAVPVRLTAPDGKVLLDGEQALTDAEATLEVPAGAKGVYVLEPKGNCWVSSSLDRSVVWTGDPTAHAVEGRRTVFQASVPRRWWFYVPPDVTKFTCRAQRADRYMSQREDWGFFVVSPRGQRIRALWGQPPHTPPGQYRQDQTVEVEVEPGAAGRFWAVDVRLGDSHNYSNINFCLDGVPPYLARSPEEWFDPDAGAPPKAALYDETPFIQSARIEEVLKARWPNLQHFSPCPSLGDPDGVEVLGDARFALWNPEGRELKMRIGTYLPRTLGGKGDELPVADVTAVGPDGKAVLQRKVPLAHIHESHGHPDLPLGAQEGVTTVSVAGAERFLAFTYPATPLVLLGAPGEGGWGRFRFSAGTVRNWYFLVPRGTKSFAVRAAAEHETDVMHFEVCAPDRTMALIYDRAGERTVEVPPGLDGKVWFLRPDVGSATRMVTTRPEGGRYLDLYLTIELKGVPALLAPTWEQWFDPAAPCVPAGR